MTPAAPTPSCADNTVPTIVSAHEPLLVRADSLAFHGPERGNPVDDPRLWPNVAAAALGGRVELVAGIGWTARNAWYALTHDPHVRAAVPRVDAPQAFARTCPAGARSRLHPG